MPTVNKNIDFDFFNRTGRYPPKIRFNVWGSACGLSMDAYKAMGKPIGLKVGIDKVNHVIHVLPIYKENIKGAIYPKSHELKRSKVVISRARIVLAGLKELGITNNLEGTVNDKNGSVQLLFKF